MNRKSNLNYLHLTLSVLMHRRNPMTKFVTFLLIICAILGTVSPLRAGPTDSILAMKQASSQTITKLTVMPEFTLRRSNPRYQTWSVCGTGASLFC